MYYIIVCVIQQHHQRAAFREHLRMQLSLSAAIRRRRNFSKVCLLLTFLGNLTIELTFRVYLPAMLARRGNPTASRRRPSRSKYTHTHTHTHTHAHTHTCTHTHTYTHTYAHTHKHTHTCTNNTHVEHWAFVTENSVVWMSVHICIRHVFYVCVCIYLYMYTFIYVCVYIHVYMYIYI